MRFTGLYVSRKAHSPVEPPGAPPGSPWFLPGFHAAKRIFCPFRPLRVTVLPVLPCFPAAKRIFCSICPLRVTVLPVLPVLHAAKRIFSPFRLLRVTLPTKKPLFPNRKGGCALNPGQGRCRSFGPELWSGALVRGFGPGLWCRSFGPGLGSRPRAVIPRGPRCTRRAPWRRLLSRYQCSRAIQPFRECRRSTPSG